MWIFFSQGTGLIPYKKKPIKIYVFYYKMTLGDLHRKYLLTVVDLEKISRYYNKVSSTSMYCKKVFRPQKTYFKLFWTWITCTEYFGLKIPEKASFFQRNGYFSINKKIRKNIFFNLPERVAWKNVFWAWWTWKKSPGTKIRSFGLKQPMKGLPGLEKL